ncbi:MAG: sugar phosphate isomerase/epimerase [Oscillospiraceae bacterium]
MKKGVQMYAIRDLASKSMEKALETVASIGYEGVEFAGFYDHSAEQIAALLKKYNLEALGAHVHEDEMFDKADETIAFHKVIGNNRIICPWYDLKTKADVLELAEKMKAVAPKYKAAGMKLFYHNHAHEFVKDGEDYLIDLLAQEVPADILSLEFDAYWVYRGGECPVKYLTKYADRIEIFHAKDGIGEQSTTLSEGAVDIIAVFEFAKKNNMAWAVAESEGSKEAEGQVEAITKDYAAMVNLIK